MVNTCFLKMYLYFYKIMLIELKMTLYSILLTSFKIAEFKVKFYHKLIVFLKMQKWIFGNNYVINFDF